MEDKVLQLRFLFEARIDLRQEAEEDVRRVNSDDGFIIDENPSRAFVREIPGAANGRKMVQFCSVGRQWGHRRVHESSGCSGSARMEG